jgi:hypothetical protein
MRYLHQLIAPFAAIAALFHVRAADSPTKVSCTLAVNSLLPPQVDLGANHNAVLHGSLRHSRVSETEAKRMRDQAEYNECL